FTVENIGYQLARLPGQFSRQLAADAGYRHRDDVVRLLERLGREQLGLRLGHFVHDLGPNRSCSTMTVRGERMDDFFIADPDPGRNVRRVALEPDVAVVLRRAGFADDRN